MVPEIRVPQVGARIGDLQEPERKMSTSAPSDAGTVYVLDEPDAILKKFKRAVTDSGTEIAYGPDKPGVSNLLDIYAAVKRVSPEDAVAAFADARGYGDLKTAVAEAVVEHLAPDPGAPTRALRPDEAELEDVARGRRREGPRDRLRARSPTCATGWASDRPEAAGSLRPRVRRSATSSWTWTSSRVPFDLLLSLILREELDLLEVDLADVVIAYVDHLEAREELDLEATTEFLVLIAALLELKSRLMLPGEEIDDLEDLAPGEAADELLARMLAYARHRGAARGCASASRTATAHLYRAAPLPPALRRAPLDGAEAVFDPALLGAALGGLLRHPPPLDLRHMAAPHVSLARPPRACCATCCGGARSPSRRRSAARTA